MELQISLPTRTATKLRKIAVQELRPVTLQAAYMLCRAIEQKRLKLSDTERETLPEVDYATKS